jgi:hypothetical protein
VHIFHKRPEKPIKTIKSFSFCEDNEIICISKIIINMNLDADFLIEFFKKHTNATKNEMGEQDAGAGAGGGTSKGNTPSKWADTVGGPARGVANSLPKKGQYWRDIVGGPKRGVANKLGTA